MSPERFSTSFSNSRSNGLVFSTKFVKNFFPPSSGLCTVFRTPLGVDSIFTIDRSRTANWLLKRIKSFWYVLRDSSSDLIIGCAVSRAFVEKFKINKNKGFTY